MHPKILSNRLAVTNTGPRVANQSYVSPEGTPLLVGAPGLLDASSDADGDALSVASYSQPSRGSVVVQPSGSFVYTPGPKLSGKDSFTYNATDGFGGNAQGTVAITVTRERGVACGWPFIGILPL
jgi:hypothetical protein